MPESDADVLAQFHGGPLDGRTLRLPRPWPRVFRAPIVQPISAVASDLPDRPTTPVAEYTNDYMAPVGRPDIYIIRESGDA